MRARTMLMAVAGLTLVAAQAQAQSYTLKIKDFPGAGKSTKTIDQRRTRTALSIAQGDKILKEDMKVEVEETEFIVKVLKPGDNKPEKFTQTFTRAAKGLEGALTTRTYVGKTIIFERRGDAYVATAEDGGVSGQDIQELTKLANKTDDVKALIPKTGVEVGDSWRLGAEALAFLGAEGVESLDLTKIRARGKLAKVYRKGTGQWGTIEFDFSAPIRKLGPLSLETSVEAQLKMTLDTAIDGSSYAGQVRGMATLKGKSAFTQNGMTFTINVVISSEMRLDATAEE